MVLKYFPTVLFKTLTIIPTSLCYATQKYSGKAHILILHFCITVSPKSCRYAWWVFHTEFRHELRKNQGSLL